MPEAAAKARGSLVPLAAGYRALFDRIVTSVGLTN